MRFTTAVILSLLASLCYAGGLGKDLDNAPPSFDSGGKKIVPVDFQFSDLELVFDVPGRRATGRARIEFYSREAGYPMFDMVPDATSVRLNGKVVGNPDLVRTPDNNTRVRVVPEKVSAFSSNLLEIEYTFPSSQVTFNSTGVRVGFFMSDVGQDRELLEQYAPSNLEFDPFQMNVKIEIRGGSENHHLFTNGQETELASNRWEVRFPAHYIASSYYLHLTNQNFSIQRDTIALKEKTIPLEVYGGSASSVSRAVTESKKLLRELEAAYGPYAHDQLVVYVTSGGGGMEYCGATMTSMGALGHEITHSWFARGVMPANGNSGWIDEAVASWRDNNYPSYSTPPSGSSVNLAGFGDYRRTTPYAAYSSGARLLAHFDRLFPSGLKGILKELFAQRQRTVIQTDEFKTFLEQESGKNLDSLFRRYVYGKSRVERGNEGGGGPLPLLSPGLPEPVMKSLHPRAYTRAELKAFR